MMPSVSVIMTVRNTGRYLRAALDSVFSQTLPPGEIILIDGQSTDDTAAIARARDGVRYHPQPDLGLANARNLGLDLAGGDLVAFLDGDDLWPADKLLCQVTRLAASPDARYSVGRIRLFTEGGGEPPPRYSAAAFEQGQAGYTPGALVARRDLFRRIGRFDPSLRLACDSDWFARLLDTGTASADVADVVLHKRIHEDNASRDLDLYRREMARVIRASVHRKQDRPAG